MKLVCYIFLFSILFSLFARLEVCINYLVNQNYYAEVLCENKEKEDSCCMGKCAMEKELVTLTEKEEPQPGKDSNSTLKITKGEEALVCTLKFRPAYGFIAIINSFFEAKIQIGLTTSLFKPPTV